MEVDEVRLLDELGAHATAATEIVRVEGWALRFAADAPFRRANSVTAFGEVDDLDDAIGRVETFYAARGLPARFQVSPTARPADLDTVLAARGYEIEAPVMVACADAARVVERTHGDALVADGVDADSVERYAGVDDEDDASERVRAYGRLLGRLELATVAAVAGPAQDEPVALGFAVAERGWAGIFGMRTRPGARRQGAATAVLHALAAWARDRGATRLYLQVETDNAPARALYRGAGFTDAYGYHYRRKDLRPG